MKGTGKTKTAVITGASAGIGRALALEFAARGYNLGLSGRRLPALEELQQQLQQDCGAAVEIAAIDVDDAATAGQALHDLIAAVGGADIVVINAGINDFTSVGGGDLEREHDIIRTNLLGAITTANAAVEHFLQRGGGHLVGMSSVASLQPIPRQAAYCASKAGFSMYLDALRIEHRNNDIDVTQIRPGFVKTEIMADIEKYPFAISAPAAAKEMLDAIEKRKPDALVPRYPWTLLRPVYGRVPDAVWKRLAK